MSASWIVKAFSWNPKTKFEGLEINLLTLEELENLKANAPATTLIAIDGEETTALEADTDTRYGYVAYGIPTND